MRRLSCRLEPQRLWDVTTGGAPSTSGERGRCEWREGSAREGGPWRAGSNLAQTQRKSQRPASFGVGRIKKNIVRPQVTTWRRILLAFLLSEKRASKPTHAYIVTILTVVLLVQRLQPLLGRNARGFRRDALGEYTLQHRRKLSCARVTCGTRALRSNVAIWR